MIDTPTMKDFVVQWLTHLSERSVRLHGYLASVAASAPRVGDIPPPVVMSILSDAQALAEDIRQSARDVFAKQTPTEGDHVVAYAGARHFVARFQSVHARLAHLPKEWVRPEIELFMRSVGMATNNQVKELFKRGTNLLENYSIVTTPTYKFANLLDDHSPDHDEKDLQWDLLSLPAIEQYNTLYWPLLVHELGHSLFQSTKLGEVSAIQGFLEARPGSYRPHLQDYFLEEIFCDLFAAAVVGPMYYVAFCMFASFWTIAPLRIVTQAHPSPETRLKYLANFLHEANSEVLVSIRRRLDGIERHRKFLDFQVNHDETNENANSITTGSLPPENDVLELATLVRQSSLFRELTEPCYRTTLHDIDPLQRRFARGEFIGTSRKQKSLQAASLEGIVAKFGEHAKALEETPNSVFDILTATACHQAGLFLSDEQLRYYKGERLELFPIAYALELIQSDLTEKDFIAKAAEYIHGTDATAIKSLEASALCEFYVGPNHVK